MSFGRLGIAHFPVLHRQFSPTSAEFPLSPSIQDDLTQDNKDILIERLSDLVQRLSKDATSMDDKAITNIHHMVDGIETLMREKPKSPKLEDLDIESEGSSTKELEFLWGPPLPRTPTQGVRMCLPEAWKSPQPSAPPKEEITVSNATEIARAAEELATQLSKTVAELQVRREESDVSLESLLFEMRH
jgi:hypothetical protein